MKYSQLLVTWKSQFQMGVRLYEEQILFNPMQLYNHSLYLNQIFWLETKAWPLAQMSGWIAVIMQLVALTCAQWGSATGTFVKGWDFSLALDAAWKFSLAWPGEEQLGRLQFLFCSSSKFAVQARWKVNKQGIEEHAFKTQRQPQYLCIGQDKLEAVGTKVGSCHQYLPTAHWKVFDPTVIAKKITRASLSYQEIRGHTCKRSYVDLSCLSPPAPEELGPLCVGLLQPGCLQAAGASTNPARQRTIRKCTNHALFSEQENIFIQSSCISKKWNKFFFRFFS